MFGVVSPGAVRPAYALDAPVPLLPVDGTETTIHNSPPLGIPTVTWAPVEGAATYKVEFSTSIGFTTVAHSNITPYTQYTPLDATNFADGTMYWRVRVEKPEVSLYSQPLTFIKTWASSDNAPLLHAPEEGTLLDFYNSPTTFSWERVTGAAFYRFEIAATSDGFSTPIHFAETLNTSYQPVAKLVNSTYYWRVVPLDLAEHQGTPSEVRSFTQAYGTDTFNQVPTQIEPADNSFPVFTPTFRWTAVEGAQYYRLEYTSDDSCDFGSGSTPVTTRMTQYTPEETFPNDDSYCWRVRAHSGVSTGEWSETWHFTKKWEIVPSLLTPTNLYPMGNYPLYSWSPVPGAAYYMIEIDKDPSFQPAFETGTTANTFYTPKKYEVPFHYWWRVTPYDANNFPGDTSEVFEFDASLDSLAPSLAYPLYYYPPNIFRSYDGSRVPVTTSPYEDRSVAFPVFIWHRLLNPAPVGGTFASAYRIEVDDSAYWDSSWQIDTENTSATPLPGELNFPQSGTYYWRVCPLDSIGGNCIQTEAGKDWWSQVWITRIDSSLALPAASGSAPTLLRPMQGQESVEATPLLEWYPYQGASEYRVQISRAADFSTTEMDEVTSIPALSPRTSLAQRFLGRTDYGTFYWRVCASSAGSCTSAWSAAWRFQITSQSEWAYDRTPGSLENRLLIASDPDDVTSNNYELTDLYASQARDAWYIGFNAVPEATNMTYVIYIDTDFKDGSGAASLPYDPNPQYDRSHYQVSTIPAHRPEYAIFIDQKDGLFSADNTWVFKWNGSAWLPGQRLSGLLLGILHYDSGYVELQLANGAIGMDETTGSFVMSVFSVDPTTGTLYDSVPSDPNVPGSGELSRFAGTSDHVNLISPPNTVSGDPSVIPSILPFSWDNGTGNISSTVEFPGNPSAGFIFQVALDEKYDPIELEIPGTSNLGHFSPPHVTALNDIESTDNVYYWQVKPRYLSGSGIPIIFGAYTGGWSFEREGFAPQNLQISVSFATPTFSWDIMEGARLYTLQVSKDSNFGSTVINVTTPMTSYTPRDTLLNGLYYWRVRATRYGSTDNDWSPTQSLNLNLPAPSGLTTEWQNVNYAPSMCWDPILIADEGYPVLSAWKYKIQVSKDPLFSTIYDTKETEQACWTPTKGYDDSTYYWRVAMIDGNSRYGAYSAAATFTKQYPVTTLISPLRSGATIPTFVWTAVDGAARYKIQIATNPNFDKPITAEVPNIHYTPIKAYTELVYYWRVAIRDVDGVYGPYTDAILVGHAIFLPIISRNP